MDARRKAEMWSVVVMVAALGHGCDSGTNGDGPDAQAAPDGSGPDGGTQLPELDASVDASAADAATGVDASDDFDATPGSDASAHDAASGTDASDAIDAGTDAGPQTCIGSGLSTCEYGQHCVADLCADAPVATSECPNFAATLPAWDPATSTGPVIYGVEKSAYQANSAYCAGPSTDAYIVRLRAYRSDTDWPASRSMLSGLFYVSPSGTQFDVVNVGLLVPGTGYSRDVNTPRNAEFNVYLCVPPNTDSYSVGFYNSDGNPACATLTAE